MGGTSLSIDRRPIVENGSLSYSARVSPGRTKIKRSKKRVRGSSIETHGGSGTRAGVLYVIRIRVVVQRGENKARARGPGKRKIEMD